MAATAPTPAPAAKALPLPLPQKVASPKAGDRKVVPVTEADEAPQVPGLHVLAVDDSSVDRAVIAKILRNYKYRVTAVESAIRAMELLDMGLIANVNMIITDYSMPFMTGYELLKRVKQSSELKEIPVVIMSSENVANRITSCMEEGAEDFLLKPVKAADVHSLCSRMIR